MRAMVQYDRDHGSNAPNGLGRALGISFVARAEREKNLKNINAYVRYKTAICCAAAKGPALSLS